MRDTSIIWLVMLLALLYSTVGAQNSENVKQIEDDYAVTVECSYLARKHMTYKSKLRDVLLDRTNTFRTSMYIFDSKLLTIKDLIDTTSNKLRSYNLLLNDINAIIANVSTVCNHGTEDARLTVWVPIINVETDKKYYYENTLIIDTEKQLYLLNALYDEEVKRNNQLLQIIAKIETEASDLEADVISLNTTVQKLDEDIKVKESKVRDVTVLGSIDSELVGVRNMNDEP